MAEEMFITCSHCVQEMPLLLSRLEEVIPHSIPVTVCQYEENGYYFDATIRLALTTKAEVLLWLEEFEALSKTTLRKSKTFPHAGGKLLYKCIYRCQHNTNQKNELTNSKLSSKNTNCPFQLTVNLRRTDVKQRKTAKDVHFHVPAHLVIRFHHNHDLDTAQVLKKRDVGADVRAKFEKLFEAGHSPSSALESHKYDLMEEGPDVFAAKVHDRRYCPDLQWCFRFYYKMFESEYGPTSAVETALALQQRVDQFNGELGERTIAFRAVDDYIVIAVCTPLMKRVHATIHQCADTVFVESSACCLDRSNECRVYVMLTSCVEVAGGLPLGVVIATAESERAIADGLELLKSLLPTDAFFGHGSTSYHSSATGSNHPASFQTPDSTPLIDALARSFPLSTVSISRYHVLADAWLNLWSRESDIPMCDRGRLYALIYRAVHAPTCQALASAFTDLHTDETAASHLGFMTYVGQLMDHSVLWAACYIDEGCSDSEGPGDTISIKMLAAMQRDTIFNRLKSFGPVQLVDFTVSRLERYFERRLRGVCRGGQSRMAVADEYRPGGGGRAGDVGHGCSKDGRIALENVWAVSRDVVLVPGDVSTSCSTPIQTSWRRHRTAAAAAITTCYFVNTSLCVCTCSVGSAGTPCRHQSAAFTKYPPTMLEIPKYAGDFTLEVCPMTSTSILPTLVRNQLQYIATGVDPTSSGGMTTSEDCWLLDVAASGDMKPDQQAAILMYVGDQNYDALITDDSTVSHIDSLAVSTVGETPASTTMSNEDDDDVARTIDRFVAFSSEMAERISLDPDTYLEPVKSFLSSYENITTSAGLVSALRCFGEYSRVASAVIAGRKRRALTRTNERISRRAD